MSGIGQVPGSVGRPTTPPALQKVEVAGVANPTQQPLPGQGIGKTSEVSAAPLSTPYEMPDVMHLVRSNVVGGGASERVGQAGSDEVSGAKASQ